MIPARDKAERQAFSQADKDWIRNWLQWTEQNRDYLRHTRSILHQPQIGKLDGTSAIQNDRGYLFLFNPNYKALRDSIRLDGDIGLETGSEFVLRELYPRKGVCGANLAREHGVSAIRFRSIWMVRAQRCWRWCQQRRLAVTAHSSTATESVRRSR